MGATVQSPKQCVVRTLTIIGVAIALSTAAVAQTPNAPVTPPAPDSLLAWAYPWDPDFKVPVADDVPHRLPGSAAAVSWIQARDLFFAPDWHPEDHPPMPAVVASGRKPDVRACGSCHRSEGTGGPENSSVAGLPVAYFVQQIADFKSGARKFSGPSRSAVTLMIAAAKAMTDAEVQSAAEYFAALKPKRNTRVVESDSAPRTYIARLFFVKRPEGGTEPLGRRIVEMPDDVEQFELRDTRSQFTAYVPPGSIAKGEALVTTGSAGKTIPCGVCHGADLTGLGPIPSIAGRSPSYIVRQLYDIQHGARTGPWSPLMANVVSKLSEDDLISIAAYLATREP
jgi:cytochrome c553